MESATQCQILDEVISVSNAICRNQSILLQRWINKADWALWHRLGKLSTRRISKSKPVLIKIADRTEFIDSLAISPYGPSLLAGPLTQTRCKKKFFAFQPTLVCPCVRVHNKTSLMSLNYFSKRALLALFIMFYKMWSK